VILQCLTELSGIAWLAAMAWGVGRGFHAVIGRSSERRRIHGQFIPEWVAGTIVAFGVSTLIYHGPVPNVPSPPSTGLAAFGLLAGLALGTIHGSVRLATPASHRLRFLRNNPGNQFFISPPGKTQSETKHDTHDSEDKRRRARYSSTFLRAIRRTH